MTNTVIYLLLSFILSVSLIDAYDAYFFPTGDRDVGNSWACNKTAYASGDGTSCCLAGDTCMGNGVCYQGWSGVMYRQSCTDRDWEASGCAQVVTKGLFNISLGVWILQCDISSKSWCGLGLDTSGSCCNNDTEGVTWSDWVPVYTIGLISNDNSDRGDNLVISAGSTTAEATTRSISSTTFTSAASSTSLVVVSSSPSTTQASWKSSSSLRTALGVGIGVGIPLLLLTIILLFWTWKERNKRRRAERQLLQMPATTSKPDTGSFLSSVLQKTRDPQHGNDSSDLHIYEASDAQQRNELWAGSMINELRGDGKQ